MMIRATAGFVIRAASKGHATAASSTSSSRGLAELTAAGWRHHTGSSSSTVVQRQQLAHGAVDPTAAPAPGMMVRGLRMQRAHHIPNSTVKNPCQCTALSQQIDGDSGWVEQLHTRAWEVGCQSLLAICCGWGFCARL